MEKGSFYSLHADICKTISNPKIIKAYDLISEVLQEMLLSKQKTVSDAIEGNK